MGTEDHQVEVWTDDREKTTVWVDAAGALEYEQMVGVTPTVMLVRVTPPTFSLDPHRGGEDRP